MSEQIIGHDCDGKPIPAGSRVQALSETVKPESRGKVFTAVDRAPEHVQHIAALIMRPGNYLLLEGGTHIRDDSTRLLQDGDHTPADEDFQADLQQWLAGSKQKAGQT